MRAFLAAILYSLLPSLAFAHDARHPQYDEWYGSLERPHMQGAAGFKSCCSMSDCHVTEAEVRGDEWWARLGTVRDDGTWDLKDWVRVPPLIILDGTPNPTGEPVLCHNVVWRMDGKTLDPEHVDLFCFVRPTQS